MLDEGTRGSPSRLDVAAFAHPFSCTLDVKKPGSEERVRRRIDLVETFDWLLGMRVRQMSETMRFSAEFERIPDPDLPADAEAMKLRVAGQLRKDDSGPFIFRTVEGTVPREREKPDGEMERVLVVWREGTGDSERDNAVLDDFLQREKVNALDGEYDIIYVNGSNNVPSLRRADQTWKVRLIEETFVKRMWEEE
jgi:adenine-specific DNA-methyltransferase